MAAKNTRKKVVVDAAAVETNDNAPVVEKIIPKEIDISMPITVYNGFQGKLVYVSKRTGEVYEWEEFGNEQEIELRELKNAKNNNRDFFSNNWFLFSDEDMWVVDYLGVQYHYKNAIGLEDFDELFEKPASEVEKILNGLSEGQKTSVSYRARQLISDGRIDSLSTISVLEKCLGVELIER